MPKAVFTDGSFTVNSVDLSSHMESGMLTMTVDVMDATGMQPPGKAREYVLGLSDNRFSGTLFQDYATTAVATNPRAALVEATLFPLVGKSTTVVVKPGSGSVSTTNPSYTFTALIASHTPFNASVGEVSKIDIDWQIDGLVAKATS